MCTILVNFIMPFSESVFSADFEPIGVPLCKFDQLVLLLRAGIRQNKLLVFSTLIPIQMISTNVATIVVWRLDKK